MISQVTLDGENARPNNPLVQLRFHGLGVPSILDALPTQAENTIQEGTLAFFGTKLYWKISGTLYEISLTQTA